MKTKTIIILCVFMSMANAHLFAQYDYPEPKNEKGTGTVNYYNTWPEYWQDVYCNGYHVDDLVGNPTFHMEIHYLKGIPLWTNERIYGEVFSTRTDEVFKLNEIDKIDWLEDGSGFSMDTWHFNLIGDQGTHYIGSMTWNFVTGEIVVNRIACPGSKN